MLMSDSKPSPRVITQILKEVQSGDDTALKGTLQKYPNFHWTELYYEKTGDTVLHCASRLGLVNIIEYLLSNFSPKSVDCKNKDDKTPLHEAAQFSQYGACQKLLQHGADVNALKRADWTPLMLACTKITEQRSLRTVNLLLENGAVVNCRNKDGWSALHLISREGDAEILKALLRYNLDINLKTKNKRTALHVASLHGNIEIVNILMDLGLNVNERDGCGNTPLQEAVLGGNIAVCKVLIRRGAEMLNTNDRGYNILHLAASKGDVDVIDFILSDLKCDVDRTTLDGFTALHCAAKNGHKDAFNYLLKRGADANIKDKCHRESLSYFR